MDITKTLVSTLTTSMRKEKDEDTYLRVEDQPSTSDLSKPSSGPVGKGNRCISTEMAEERLAFEPTVETDPPK